MENIRSNTTVYTPIVEVIVNAIQAIDQTKREDGRVLVRAMRSAQAEMDLDGGLPNITGFVIQDNGCGFDQTNRDSFDELYTDAKLTEGGKGFGRFTCLKYFNDLHVSSVFREGDSCRVREFYMGKNRDIVVGELIRETDVTDTGSTISLIALKPDRSIDKKLSTIARNLVERLLPYFITKDYKCPDIILCEEGGEEEIRLNDFVSDSDSITEIDISENSFTLSGNDTEERFFVRVFKFYSPRNQTSKISLVAHRREVSAVVVQKYIPEFEDEFYEPNQSGRGRNFIIKAYVFGSYLDNNVSLERGGFEFGMDSDVIHGIGQQKIEKTSAEIARSAVGPEIALRQEKKKVRVQSYVDTEAPWHKELLNSIDLGDMPYNPTNEEIETRLQKAKFENEVEIRRQVKKILDEPCLGSVTDDVKEIVNKISETGKNDLIHYIAQRRRLLDLLEKSLFINESGAYAPEGVVHDIIFPRRGDTEITSFRDHNLWILDERLNFTEYVSSDVPLDRKRGERPDLAVYNKRVVFRGDNEASNPITIFELKKPQRDDFVNPSSNEDPVQQIVRYVNDIRDGRYKTPDGRKIHVSQNTPFYGYVICDFTPKIDKWLEREKNFTPMPDRMGWFHWYPNINLYIEVLSWDKVFKDAKIRNAIFFKKLGIGYN